MSTSEERGRLAEDVTLTHHAQVELARILMQKGYNNAAIAHIMRIDESTVRLLLDSRLESEPMPDPEIIWGYNCLTQGVHHGRPDAIWNIPLNYAIKIFSRTALRELVISRIYNDAMQFVEHSDTDHAITTPEWAERVKLIAGERYERILRHKVGEISRYYNTPEYALEIQRAAVRFTEGKLSTAYLPLHAHDSINMLCRILGTSSSIRASES